MRKHLLQGKEKLHWWKGIQGFEHNVSGGAEKEDKIQVGKSLVKSSLNTNGFKAFLMDVLFIMPIKLYLY